MSGDVTPLLIRSILLMGKIEPWQYCREETASSGKCPIKMSSDVSTTAIFKNIEARIKHDQTSVII